MLLSQIPTASSAKLAIMLERQIFELKNMKSKLTIKQEKFCLKYLECGNASEAYRHAYSCANMKPETVNNKACDLLKKGEIRVRVDELQEEAKRKSDITKEEILGLCVKVIRGEDIIDVKRKTSDTVSAQTISKTWAIERVCKMLGFEAPTQSEVTGKVSVEQMTDEERKERITRIYESLNR